MNNSDNGMCCQNTNNFHRQFIILGRERNKITYKLLSLLPQIYKQKIYQKHGYATIYEYAGKLAGLSHSVVEKALKLEEKLKDKPNLQKVIETQGVHKVSIIASIATPENEKMFADKVENMSKPALQQFSKELRGKIQTSWQIEMDEEMMKMFLKIKKEIGGNLSNKEALRRMLAMMVKIDWQNMKGRYVGGAVMMVKMGNSGYTGGLVSSPGKETLCAKPTMMAKNEKTQAEAKNPPKIPGERTRSERSERSVNPEISLGTSAKSSDEHIFNEYNKQKTNPASPTTPLKITRYIPAAQKRKILASTNGQCSHKNCHNPAQIFHHQIRFSQTPNHTSIIPLCKIHHEFAHNGITETLNFADTLYRKHRQESLL